MSSSPAPRPPRWIRLLTGMVIVLVAGVSIWWQLPDGAYPTDLSRVGQGHPALVLAYDHHYVGGGEVMERMHAIRAEHGGAVEFLVADMSEATGRAFAERHGVNDGTVLLFAGDGTRVGTLHTPDADEIRRAMNESFAR